MQAPIVFGIPNCDQVRKARTWLAEHGIAYRFHDLRKDGIDRALIEHWIARVPWETLVNCKGTTWRGLNEEQKRTAAKLDGAIALMLEHPSVIKRPVIEFDDQVSVGADAAMLGRIQARLTP